MIKANINHITRLRINSDGEGVRSVVFTHGCPLDCVWCCNPETHKIEKFRTLTTQELYNYISGDIPYFLYSSGGITFSGGEPLLHTNFIEEFILEYCNDFSVNIETSLYTETQNLIKLYPLINEWYIDFKVFDEQKHIEYTGVSNECIKENLRFLADKISKEKIIITYPLIPNYNISDGNLYDMMSFLNDIGIYKVELHPYRKTAKEKNRMLGIAPADISSITPESFNAVKYNFLSNGFEVVKRENYFEKEKCKYLKNIRKEICAEKQILLDIKDCSFEGRCVGTCPQCEYELDFINNWG